MSITADDLPELPIRAVLPELSTALATAGTAVLVAPPGTGKTTVVPLALALDAAPGRIVVAEPRRVAARAAARRMAALTGTDVGDLIGFTVRGERRVSARTRVEVVTTGVLVRRMQRDPELPGTAAVILDECHERHLDTDLALAFLIDVRAALRPDLTLLATSATAEAERLSALLGSAPVVEAAEVLHPLDVHWCPPPQPVKPPHGSRVDPRLLDHVAATVRRALHDGDGDVLAFLPGAREIDAVAARLGGTGLTVIGLHGRQDAATQDAALRPGTTRRVVLATAVAESSLTVPGVRAVVDAGLSRVPRTDHARGLGTLVTVPVSRAAAHQRAGRAAREAPGRVYRCWAAAQHDRLPAQPSPEVEAADLTGFALDLAQWGHPDGTGLALWDSPPAGALQAARSTLLALGAVDADGRITARGRELAGAGLHPRLARALLDGAPLVGGRRAAELVALLDGERITDDVVASWRRARGDRAWQHEVGRLRRLVPDGAAPALTDDLAAGLVVALAYPERVARVRGAGSRAYLMAGGTEATLDGGSGLNGTPWLAVADAERAPGAPSARIRSAAPLDEETARTAAAPLATTRTEVTWHHGDVVAREAEKLGAITLTERRLDKPDPELVRAALREGLRRDGLSLLTWSRGATELRERLAFARHALGDPWPDVSDEALTGDFDWLDLGRARRRSDLAAIDVAGALRGLLPWSVAGRLEEVAPERLTVPTGSRVRVDYSDPAAPFLAVKLQECFGWQTTPLLADGRVPLRLHLLSPAGRPLAVTSDLTSFWRNAYPQVRSEMRGRYPRHPWPEDPSAAAPTRRVNPRR